MKMLLQTFVFFEWVAITTKQVKLPLDFYNYTKLKGYVNFFSSCSIAPPNKLFLGCKPLSFALKKKQCHVRNSCQEAFCQKALLQILQNSQDAETPVLQPHSNIIAGP